MNDHELKKNGEGYQDPTAYEAIKNVDGDQERFNKLLRLIFGLCDMAGFHIEERIVLKDKQTGRVWK